MLDTIIVSQFLKNDSVIVERIKAIDPSNLIISAVTRAELRYGLVKRPDSTRLHRIV